MIRSTNKIGRFGGLSIKIKDPNLLQYIKSGVAERDGGSLSFRLMPEMIEANQGSVDLIQLSTGKPYTSAIGTNIKVTFTVKATIVNTSDNTTAQCSVGMFAFKKEGGIDGLTTKKVNFNVPQESTGSRTYSSTWEINTLGWQALYNLYPYMSSNTILGSTVVSIEAEVYVERL